MSTLKAQTVAKIAESRAANPNFMKGVDDLLANAKLFKQGESAINIGQSVPMFELPDAKSNVVSLNDLLTKGPVVITFYRGSWCPYCNLQLRALQARLDEINALGAQLVAISPQMPDGSMKAKEIDEMGFTVLSDQDAKVAEQLGVAWQVPDHLIQHMRNDRGLDLESINNGNGRILPIPATFVVDKNANVVWRYVDVDYRTRSEPEDIITALKQLI
jgi:peroxiredoxin